MITETVLPPSIASYFNKHLLSNTCAMGDNPERLLKIWKYIESSLFPKLKNMPERRRECELLKAKFLELYGRIETKEKDTKATKYNKAQGFFYHIELPNKSDRTIFEGLRYRRAKVFTTKRQNDDV